MTKFKLVLTAAFLAGGAVASLGALAATQHTIGEKGKVFSQAEISIKTGDSVLFVNDDTIAHNVMSQSPEATFNLGLIKPGTATPVAFNTAGDILIICAIHPTMKMHVKVAN